MLMLTTNPNFSLMSSEKRKKCAHYIPRDNKLTKKDRRYSGSLNSNEKINLIFINSDCIRSSRLSTRFVLCFNQLFKESICYE